MWKIGKRGNKTLTTAVAASILGVLLGAPAAIAPAWAAPIPTMAVTTAGDSDWQVTYARGSATRQSARCRVWLDDRIVASPERSSADPGRRGDVRVAPPSTVTTTLRGWSIAPGAHRVNVRCGRSASPTVWLIAPRNQVFDGVTWLSNGTAGVIGY